MVVGARSGHRCHDGSVTEPSNPAQDVLAGEPRHCSGRSRHGRPPVWRLPRFGPLALALGTVLGLTGGVGAGLALDGPTVGRTVVLDAALGTPSATEDTETASRDGAPGGGQAPTAPKISASDLDSASDSTALPQALTTPSLPPAPAPLDPVAVDAMGLTFADRQAGLLSVATPASASGELVVVPGSAAAPFPDRAVRSVRVEVEAGLDVDPALFALTVMATLNDPRSWGGDGSMSFARTDGEAELRVVLASAALTDVLCAPLATDAIYSCGLSGRAVLNYGRWVRATPEFADRTVYRQYLVNHEVGHLLGHGHVACPTPGAVAPVMQQQTIAVAPCVVNGWPLPDAAGPPPS